MYEADDLTEETEEIILQRTKNQVDRAKFLLEGAIKRDKQFNEVVVPREVISIEDAYDRKKLSMATIRKILPVELRKKKLELQKLEEERAKLQDQEGTGVRSQANEPSFPGNGNPLLGNLQEGEMVGNNQLRTKTPKGGHDQTP